MDVDAMSALLEDSAMLGLCERDANGLWRLTDEAERRHGAALRLLDLEAGP